MSYCMDLPAPIIGCDSLKNREMVILEMFKGSEFGKQLRLLFKQHVVDSISYLPSCFTDENGDKFNCRVEYKDIQSLRNEGRSIRNGCSYEITPPAKSHCFYFNLPKEHPYLEQF